MINKIINRRNFLYKSALSGAGGVIAPWAISSAKASGTPRMITNDISIAQWALVDEVHKGVWKTVDFPKVAREDFDINGIEFVNTLFEVPTVRYLNTLKRNADNYGVKMVLVMVDDEGET